MHRIYDRRSQRTLGLLDDGELAAFRALMLQPAVDDDPAGLDPAAWERLEAAGVSDALRLVVQQALDGASHLDLGWEPATGQDQGTTP